MTASPTASALRAVTSGQTLTAQQAEAAMGAIMDGDWSPIQIAGLLAALRTRGETVAEITGFARAMRARVVPVEPRRRPLVDACGTGGDSPRQGCSTFNISTAAALIAAGAGVAVAKHGNRAMSSRCGSADVLEALGVNLQLSPAQIARCIDEAGIGFIFAQAHHPAMKTVGPVRRELGIRTVFNLLGPLTNPAGATRQVVGVPGAEWLLPIAEALRQLGTEHAIVVHSRDGMDEFSTCAPTDYIEVNRAGLTEATLDAADFGCACPLPETLQGGDSAENASIILRLLDGNPGPPADIACLNAAAVLLVAGAASSLSEGMELARETLVAGKARAALRRLVELSVRLKNDV